MSSPNYEKVNPQENIGADITVQKIGDTTKQSKENICTAIYFASTKTDIHKRRYLYSRDVSRADIYVTAAACATALPYQQTHRKIKRRKKYQIKYGLFPKKMPCHVSTICVFIFQVAHKTESDNCSQYVRY